MERVWLYDVLISAWFFCKIEINVYLLQKTSLLWFLQKRHNCATAQRIFNWFCQNQITISWLTDIRWKSHKICPKTVRNIWKNKCITFSWTRCIYACTGRWTTQKRNYSSPIYWAGGDMSSERCCLLVGSRWAQRACVCSRRTDRQLPTHRTPHAAAAGGGGGAAVRCSSRRRAGSNRTSLSRWTSSSVPAIRHINRLIDCVVFLRPTQHRIGRFGDVSPWLGMEKI